MLLAAGDSTVKLPDNFYFHFFIGKCMRKKKQFRQEKLGYLEHLVINHHPEYEPTIDKYLLIKNLNFS